MDKIIEKIVALGVPGLVLVFAVSSTGVSGAAATVGALAFLGGPFGMLGGIATLGVLTLISRGIAQYGLEAIAQGTISRLQQQGMSKHVIRAKIESYPISRGLKDKTLRSLSER